MKNQDYYEINLSDLLARCLIHWKVITAIALAVTTLVWGISMFSFRADTENTLEYHEISSAITQRSNALQQLTSAQRDLSENLFRIMDPNKLVTKRLSIAVTLDDSTQITDQSDPTDLILYAYHSLALTYLQENTLIPSVLTRLQQEQLLSLNYDSQKNILLISMTADNEALIDTVLSQISQWHLNQQSAIALQIQPHRLTILPVSNIPLTLAEREALVSTIDAETRIQSLKDQIFAYNATLDSHFQQPEGWSATMSATDLTDALLRWQQDPPVLTSVAPIIGGFCFGLLLASLGVCLLTLITGRFRSESSLSSMLSWHFIGRLQALTPSRDPIVQLGQQKLHHNIHASKTELTQEVRDMTRLLLHEQNLKNAASIAVLGELSLAEQTDIHACLQLEGLHIQFASLSQNRVFTIQLCQEADAIIFAARANSISTKEINTYNEIFTSMKKTPLGFLLV